MAHDHAHAHLVGSHVIVHAHVHRREAAEPHHGPEDAPTPVEGVHQAVHNTYANLDELKAIVGDPKGSDERLELALVMASRWVDLTCGYDVALGDGNPVPQDPIVHPVSSAEVPVPVGAHNATLVAAARFLRSGDVPLGVLGGLGDYAVRIRSEIPEAELHLVGLRGANAWGIG